MTGRVQLDVGQRADLRAGYLRARLTGDVGAARLLVDGPDDPELVQSRDSDHEVVILPTGVELSLLVVPSFVGEFVPGTRVGLELDAIPSGAGGVLPDGAVVSGHDVGAFRNVELARLIGQESRWMIGVATAPSARFGFLMDEAPVPRRLDERYQPWVSEGRYILRRSRHGAAVEPSRRHWAVVLDSSASFAAQVTTDGAVALATIVSGILAEDSGVSPAWIGSTGLFAPVSHSHDPSRFADSLDATRPASWCLAAPSIMAAIDAGADRVAVVTDGPPTDLSAVDTLVRDHPRLEVALVVVGRQGSTADEDEPIAERVGGRLRSVGLAVSSDGSADDQARERLARALTEARR